jgi:hypothetical protein
VEDVYTFAPSLVVVLSIDILDISAPGTPARCGGFLAAEPEPKVGGTGVPVNYRVGAFVRVPEDQAAKSVSGGPFVEKKNSRKAFLALNNANCEICV